MYNETKMLQVGVNKSLLKEYKVKNDSRVVYLENGKEFQLQLYNPTSATVAAEIYLNGNRISSRLVLRPAERVWLDRYLDRSKKFKFETYEVDGDADTQKIIERSHNGEIMVKFYREDTSVKDYSVSINYTYDRPLTAVRTFNAVDSAATSISATSISGNYDASTCYLLDADITELADVCTNSLTTATLTDGTIQNCIGAITSSSCNGEKGVRGITGPMGMAATPKDDTIETGRVEEGGYSDQKLDSVNKEFVSWAFNTETIKIIPISQKPVTVNDVQKCYCPECGHRLKNNYKFCPYCGCKIEDD